MHFSSSITQFLMQHMPRPNLDAKDMWQQTPLLLARKQKANDTAFELIEGGASIDDEQVKARA